MSPEEDVRRVHLGMHDVQAAEDPAALTAAAVLQSAVVFVCLVLRNAIHTLVAAVMGLARQHEAIHRQRQQVLEATEKAVVAWRFIQSRVRERLLNSPPDQWPNTNEQAQTKRLFDRLFPVSPSDFGALAVDRRILMLRSLLEVVNEEAVQEALGELADEITRRVTPVAAELGRQQEKLFSELRKERAARATLTQARKAFDHAHVTHTKMVEAVLVAGGRRNELGRYLRAHDPAYRARRLAGRPMKEEPGVEAASSAIGVTLEAPG